MIRVLLVDDHRLFRQGLRAFLERSTEFTVVGEAADGLEAIHLPRELAPDIILMDINMPVLDGLRAAESIRKEQPGANVVFLTLSHDSAFVERARALGGKGFLSKDICCDQLSSALNQIHHGITYYPDEKKANAPGPS